MPISKPKPEIQDPPDYHLDEQVGFVLRRATQRHLAIFSETIPDLTSTQFAALAKLNEVGQVSQNELGRQTAMDAATIKGVIDRLRKREFVKTGPDPNDQRRLFVQATRSGQQAYLDTVAAAHEITRQTLAPLNAGEQAVFRKLLRKLT